MTSLKPYLTSLLSSLPPSPIPEEALDALVRKTLEESKGKSSPENVKAQWEYLLREEIFNLAVRFPLSFLYRQMNLTILQVKEGQALKEEETTYYDQLQDKLDMVLAFCEYGLSFSHCLLLVPH